MLRLSCVVHEQIYIWPFYGLCCKRFSLRVNLLHYNPQNGHKSAHGPYRRDVTHILCKVSCIFFYWNPFIFVGYGNDRFFSLTNPRGVQILIFRMLLNNADVRRCVYFELRLPVVLLCVSRNIPLPCKVPPLPFFLFKKVGKERPSSRERHRLR